MTFIKHYKSLSTYKKYYSLYYQKSTQGRVANPLKSRFFCQGQPVCSSNFILTKYPYSLSWVAPLFIGKNRDAASFFPCRQKRRVLLNMDTCSLHRKPHLNKALFRWPEMMNIYISTSQNKSITKLRSFECSIKNVHVSNILKHKRISPAGVLNSLKPLQGSCSKTLKIYFAFKFFFPLNSLRIQNSFVFNSYDQKWNQRFTIQNFRSLINKTQFSGGAFNILAKRQRFIRNSLKGILLVNFPEKEKNFLIKNLAAENKIALITQSASLLLKDSRNMDDLLGVDDPIQILFDKVKTCIPCICFINNLDRIGKQRYEQEQKSLHWLNNSISLSLDQHFTSDRIFNSINTKQRSGGFDFLGSTPAFFLESNHKPSLTIVSANKKSSLNTKYDLSKQSNLNKTFGFYHDFKNTAPAGIFKNIPPLQGFQITRFINVQNNNPTAWPTRGRERVLKYLTWFGQPSNKNKLKSIRPFLNSLVKLSVGSNNSMYTNSNKLSFLQFSIKNDISYFINYTPPLQGVYKLKCYRYFLKKISYVQNSNNTLNEKYNTYPKDEFFEPWSLIFKYSSFIQNAIWYKKPYYILKKKPIFFSASPVTEVKSHLRGSVRADRREGTSKVSHSSKTRLWLFRHATRWMTLKKQAPLVPLPEDKSLMAGPEGRGEKRRVLLNTNAKKKILVASKIPLARVKLGNYFLLTPSNELDGEITKRKKYISDRISKFKTTYYHRLPYWLFKNWSPPAGRFFFEHKINIGKLKLFNWFYDKKKREENILTSLKAKVSPLLLQIAFCQSQYKKTNPIFAKIKSNMIHPQTNLENLSKISVGGILKNLPQAEIKSNNTKIYANKLKYISKRNMYDIVSSARAETRKKKLSFKDLGKINTNQKSPSGARIFVDFNIQSFNSKVSIFAPTRANFDKTNAFMFNDIPVTPEFKESTSYDSLFSNKQKNNQNNSFKITETEIIKRTALLKFLQILDGFHTTHVYKYKQTWLKPFSYINSFSLTNNYSIPEQNENPSSQSSGWRIYNKPSFLIRPCGDNIQFRKMNKLKKNSVRKLKQIKKSSIDHAIMLKPAYPQTNLYQKIYRHVRRRTKNNSLQRPSYILQEKTFPYVRVANKIPKWEVYLKNQPSGKSLNLLCVWPSYIDDIMGPLNLNDSASYLLPEYFQLLGHGPKLKKQGITLIASTNNLATLDAALLRPGRFDTIINFSHRLSSIYKSFKILKHSPSLIECRSANANQREGTSRSFSLSVNLPINKLTPLVYSLSFMNISKTIKNQFYPQLTTLDMPSQSTSIKTFIDVSIFIQYKLWWSFNNDKLSPFRLYPPLGGFIQKFPKGGSRLETDVSDFEKSLDRIFKYNISVVILVLTFPIKKIKDITYIFISILRMIYFQFSGRADSKEGFLKYFVTFKEKLVGVKAENLFFRLSNLQALRFPFIDKYIAGVPFKSLTGPLPMVGIKKQKLALSENFDMNQTRLTTEKFIINPSSNWRKETSSINALSREVLTCKIINLGLPKNLSTLNYVLDPNFTYNKEAWTVPNYKNTTIHTNGNAKNSRSPRMESYNFHIKDSDMFSKFNRRLLFCKGDFDYKLYSKNNSEIILIKTNLKNPRMGGSQSTTVKIFGQSIGVTIAERLYINELIYKHRENKPSIYNSSNTDQDIDGFSSAIAIKNPNINNLMLTKYNKIYKLKKIKLKKQSFFNLHPFTSFMLKRWSEIAKSNKLKRHLKISLVKTNLPWTNEISNCNDFDSSKLLNMKASLHNYNSKYDQNHRVADLKKNSFPSSGRLRGSLNWSPPAGRSNIEKPLNSELYQENKMVFSVQNFWSLNSDIMSLYNKIYQNIYSATLLIPVSSSLLKRESLKTFDTNNFSTYESYLFKKLRKNFSINIIDHQIDSTLILPLKQLLQGEITDLKKRINNDFFENLQISTSCSSKETRDALMFSPMDRTPSFEKKIKARPRFWREKKVSVFKHEYSKTDNYKTSLTFKNKIFNIHLLEKENLLKKIPRKSVISHSYNNFQVQCKFKYLKNNESEINNNIILLKNLASNKKKHNFIQTYESFFPPGAEVSFENDWPSFNKFNGSLHEMCRLDITFFILIFYIMFFEKIQHQKITLKTIKIFMPYQSLIFSHFLLSKAGTYDFSCKNFEILIYNKFKNFLDL